jgi:uncharacterized membrane protein (UPF0127 family)
MARGHFLARLVAEPGVPHCLFNDALGCLLAASVEPAFDSTSRRKGLLGRDALAPDSALIIAPSNAVHTFGMRFPIDLLFVSRSGRVVKRVTALRRRRIAAAWGAFAVVEFCANHPGVASTKPGDRLRVERQQP